MRELPPTLSELAHKLDAELVAPPELHALRPRGVRQDSRQVEPGELFVARAGGARDGQSFVQDALGRGAIAVVLEHAAAGCVDAPRLLVRDARRALAFAAEAVYGEPSRALPVIGITGTNGKTTSAWVLEHALTLAGRPSARLGTLGYAFGEEHEDFGLTTPEADAISRYVARARDAGAQGFVMEASSHALALARVEALHFEVAAFTNLSQDHLDFHGSFEAYFAAKRRLFTDLEPAHSVIHVGDAHGARLANEAHGQVWRVGAAPGADVRPRDVRVDARGLFGVVDTPRGPVELASPLVGAHNLENLLVALGVALALGDDGARFTAALSQITAVPGRLERCDAPDDDVTVLVDYAHTPDALERVLVAVRALGAGGVHCVFGCGGDRDPGKRSLMGAVVGRLADRAIVTNDNPRSEVPERIAEAILEGLVPTGISYEVELDRARAVERAVLAAAPGDVVLVAGKGHEPYQIVGGVTRPFDDRVEARRALALRRHG